MNVQMIIALCILGFMIFGLLTSIFPFGLTAVICCIAFVVTGICDIPTAFSGLSSSTTVLVASMMVIACFLSKTDAVIYLRASIKNIQGKRGGVLFALIAFFTIVLSQVLDLNSALLVMLTVTETLDEDNEMSPARMFFVVVALNLVWGLRFPIGMGATQAGLVNSFYQGMVGPENLLAIDDFLKVGIIPSIVGTIYCFLCYKWIPKSGTKIKGSVAITEQERLSKKDNIIIYISFIVSTIGFGLTNLIGRDMANIIPAVMVVVMIVFKVIQIKEAVGIMTGDLIWMMAGMTTLSTVLASTGLGELIGSFVLKILGNDPSGLLVITVFAVTAAIMTNIMSNIGTIAVLTPIAASTALAGGMNVRTIVIVVGLAAVLPAYILPTACSSAALGYSMTGINPFKAMKFTIPLAVLMIITLIISANIFLPVY